MSDRGYVLVWAALMVLLGATVAASYLGLGRLGIALALGIAGVKTLLVVAYFMHLKDEERLLWIAAASGFIWLALLIVGTLDEMSYRALLP